MRGGGNPTKDSTQSRVASLTSGSSQHSSGFHSPDKKEGTSPSSGSAGHESSCSTYKTHNTASEESIEEWRHFFWYWSRGGLVGKRNSNHDLFGQTMSGIYKESSAAGSGIPVGNTDSTGENADASHGLSAAASLDAAHTFSSNSTVAENSSGTSENTEGAKSQSVVSSTASGDAASFSSAAAQPANGSTDVTTPQGSTSAPDVKRNSSSGPVENAGAKRGTYSGEVNEKSTHSSVNCVASVTKGSSLPDPTDYSLRQSGQGSAGDNAANLANLHEGFSKDLTETIKSADSAFTPVGAEVLVTVPYADRNSVSGKENTHSSRNGVPLSSESSHTSTMEEGGYSCVRATSTDGNAKISGGNSGQSLTEADATKSSSGTTRQQNADISATTDSTTSHSGEPMEASGVPFSKLSSVTASPHSDGLGHTKGGGIFSLQKYRVEVCHWCNDYRTSSLMR